MLTSRPRPFSGSRVCAMPMRSSPTRVGAGTMTGSWKCTAGAMQALVPGDPVCTGQMLLTQQTRSILPHLPTGKYTSAQGDRRPHTCFTIIHSNGKPSMGSLPHIPSTGKTLTGLNTSRI